MITAGIDCGSKNTKIVILKDGIIIANSLIPTGFEQGRAVEDSLAKAVGQAGIDRNEFHRIAVTGAGAGAVAADCKVNDVRAIAAGARYFFPAARTVLDVGAEESRVVACDEKGHPVDFAVNDKCAAGSGAFIEAMARALETPLDQIGLLALSSDNTIAMNAHCTIFAESEVVGLIHSNADKRSISRAIHDALAARIASMVRRVGIAPEVVMIGGVANNPALVDALTRELGVGKIFTPEHPEFGAATGAAVVAAEEAINLDQ